VHLVRPEDETSGARAGTFGDHQQIDLERPARRRPDRHAGVVLGHLRDRVAVDQLDPVGNGVQDDAGEVPAQHLELGGGSLRAVGGQGGAHSAGRVDHDGGVLGGVRGLHRVEEAHPLQHVPGQTADVDVLPAVAEARRPLEDGHLPSGSLQPERGREPRDARAGHDRSVC